MVPVVIFCCIRNCRCSAASGLTGRICSSRSCRLNTTIRVSTTLLTAIGILIALASATAGATEHAALVTDFADKVRSVSGYEHLADAEHYEDPPRRTAAWLAQGSPLPSLTHQLAAHRAHVDVHSVVDSVVRVIERYGCLALEPRCHVYILLMLVSMHVFLSLRARVLTARGNAPLFHPFCAPSRPRKVAL